MMCVSSELESGLISWNRNKDSISGESHLLEVVPGNEKIK